LPAGRIWPISANPVRNPITRKYDIKKAKTTNGAKVAIPLLPIKKAEKIKFSPLRKTSRSEPLHGVFFFI
jgi:hypothetical protein